MRAGLTGLRERARRLVPRELKALSGRTPLRIKLISAVLALVALALLVFSVASVFLMRSYLAGQADLQLVAASQDLNKLLTKHKLPYDRDTGQNYLPAPFGIYGQLQDASGTVFFRTQPPQPGAPLPSLPVGVAAHDGQPFTVREASGDHERWRVLTQQLPQLPGNLSYSVAISLKPVDNTVRRLMLVDLLLGGAVVIVLATVGAGIVRASLKPLEEIETTAEAIAKGDLSQRVPDRDPRTEVGRLGRSLNGMLGQIETAFQAQMASEAQARGSEERMRRFVADASHELRTPLTAIRGFAEFYRQGAARTPTETQKLLGRIEDAASRMGLLVEDLLMLARMDQQRPLARRPVDLLAVAADAVQETRVTAPDRSIELSLNGDAAFQVLGDEQRLRQVLGNLLSNAVVHTPDGTPVKVRLGTGELRGAPAAFIEVIDQGPGLAPEVAERVFERFYRADAARSRGGTGLGLSIVAALVAAHEGTVDVASKPGHGATFRVTLPLAL